MLRTFKEIYKELVAIRKELQEIRKILEPEFENTKRAVRRPYQSHFEIK